MGETTEDLKEFFENNGDAEHVRKPELLLHPNLPKPLHGINPRTLMGKEQWDVERKKAYSKHDYHCLACGIYAAWNEDAGKFAGEQKLHAHEAYDIDYTGRTAELVEIVAICPLCHSYIHSGRTQALYGKGVLDECDCWYIYTHGNSILIDMGVSPSVKKVDTRTYEDEWSDWCLVIDGVKHYSNFESYKQWKEHYSG